MRDVRRSRLAREARERAVANRPAPPADGRCAICEQVKPGRMRKSAVHGWIFVCAEDEAACVARGWLPMVMLEGE